MGSVIDDNLAEIAKRARELNKECDARVGATIPKRDMLMFSKQSEATDATNTKTGFVPFGQSTSVGICHWEWDKNAMPREHFGYMGAKMNTLCKRISNRVLPGATSLSDLVIQLSFIIEDMIGEGRITSGTGIGGGSQVMNYRTLDNGNFEIFVVMVGPVSLKIFHARIEISI